MGASAKWCLPLQRKRGSFVGETPLYLHISITPRDMWRWTHPWIHSVQSNAFLCLAYLENEEWEPLLAEHLLLPQQTSSPLKRWDGVCYYVCPCSFFERSFRHKTTRHLMGFFVKIKQYPCPKLSNCSSSI